MGRWAALGVDRATGRGENGQNAKELGRSCCQLLPGWGWCGLAARGQGLGALWADGLPCLGGWRMWAAGG